MSSSVEDDAMPRNNRHKTITECMNECKSALNKISNSAGVAGVRDKCIAFKSDFSSKNVFKASDVEEFAKKFKVIKFEEILPPIDVEQNTRHFDDSKKYDSVWTFITRRKTFKAERFFYCRVYNGNDRSMEVVMIWVYLEARLKHKTTILPRIDAVFEKFSDQASKIVGRAVANIVDKICDTSSRMTNDLLPNEQTMSKFYSECMMMIIVAAVVVVLAISFVLFYPSKA